MAGSNAPMEIASAIQSTSINRHPSPKLDLNPSTAASQKQPVTIACSPAESDVAGDEIPLSVLRPMPRRTTMPPLPDLRFEQSYLKSIEGAKSWKGVLWITFRDQVSSLSYFPWSTKALKIFIISRIWQDFLQSLTRHSSLQVLLSLTQGAIWTLLLSGWRYWNRSSQFSGHSVGARIRRWWWGVNNWVVLEDKAWTIWS